MDLCVKQDHQRKQIGPKQDDERASANSQGLVILNTNIFLFYHSSVVNVSLGVRIVCVSVFKKSVLLATISLCVCTVVFKLLCNAVNKFV